MDDPAEHRSTRRRFLAAAAATGTAALSGCLSTDLSAEAPGLPSDVFKLFSVANSIAVGSSEVRVNAALTEAATTEMKVRELTAVDSAGATAWNGTVQGGQTSVGMYLPVGTPLTVYAFDHSANPVGEQSLRIRARSLP